MPDSKLTPVTMIASATGLVIGVLTIWFFVTSYVDKVAADLKADYIERDTAVVQMTATKTGERNRDLRTIMERSYMDGYDAIIDLIEDRIEVLKDRVKVVSEQTETAVTRKEMELLADEAERLERVETLVEKLKDEADNIWIPN